MAADHQPSRRELFELLGAGIVFQFVAEGAEPRALGSRLHIAPDGAVTLLTGKVEIGQGCRTLLAQCVAEEMRIDIGRVRVIMADTALVPDDGGTFASLTTPLAVPMVRQAAAAARELLRTVPPDQVMLREIPVKVDLSKPADWKVLGKPHRRVNDRAIVTGALKYAGDLKVPGMLAGKVVRPEAYSAELAGFDGAAAERIPGVKVVRDGGFLGVVGPDEATVEKAAALVKAEWRAKELIRPPELFEHFKKTAIAPKANMTSRYPPLLEKGAVAEALAGAATRHEASYTLPSIAHVPLEPRAAIALWDEKGLTVQSSSQVPFAVRRQLATAFSIPEERVRLIGSEMGGGFGGKHGPEVMLEAARLARGAGKPVRLQWTREEEFSRSYCRPAGLVEVKSGLSAEGRIVAWDFINYHSGAASLALPYAIPNYRCAHHRADSPLRHGPYRSLAAVANTFARESHVDELAALAKADPVEFRLRHIDNPRTREAIERAAERFGWAKRRRNACGMACNLEKDGHMALFLELDGSGKGVRVVRMVMTFDCGAVLNPLNLENQVAGALIMGIGGALFEELRYDKTKVLNGSLAEYRVPQFADAPSIDVILIDRREVVPAGAGESAISVVAPAIAAALFQADGRRRRALPLNPA
jgi:CO/xanthine dehydrogenase Mo-binding subunit